MAARTDLFTSPDYFGLDELLTEEHLLIRESVRNYVKKEISPIIEDYAQKAEFPQQIVKQLGDLGCFGPTVPVEYGGGGLDYVAYGLMMQELERGDSGVRSRLLYRVPWSCSRSISMAVKNSGRNTFPNLVAENGWVVLV